MNQLSNRTYAIILILCVLSAPAFSMVVRPRLLSRERVPYISKTNHFGSTGFLGEMFLKKRLADSSGTYSPEQYNSFFFNVVNGGAKKALELFLVYMKTFQKDFSNKCKMAMLKNIADIRTSGEQPFYLARCEFVAETVFRYLHTTVMFYNIEYIIKTIHVLVDSETVLMVFEGESEEVRVARNKAFFVVLERAIAEALLGDEDSMNWVSQRFAMINDFYGPNFMPIFTGFIDSDEHAIHRHEIGLRRRDQDLMDWGFQVHPILAQMDNRRLAERTENEHVDNRGIYDVSYRNLYRYYGNNFDKPFYDVKKFHMFMHED